MKKTLAGLFTAALMIAGLETVASAPAVHASVAPASAVSQVHAKACYPGSVGTTSSVSGPQIVKKGKKATFHANVKASSGTGSPSNGKIRLRVRRNGEIVRERFRSYSGSPVNIIFPGPAVLGDYNVFVKYIPAKCSVYNESALTETSFTVTK